MAAEHMPARMAVTAAEALKRGQQCNQRKSCVKSREQWLPSIYLRGCEDVCCGS